MGEIIRVDGIEIEVRNAIEKECYWLYSKYFRKAKAIEKKIYLNYLNNSEKYMKSLVPKIKRLKKVQNVEFKNGELIISTEPLFCIRGKSKYFIGSFDIFIDSSGFIRAKRHGGGSVCPHYMHGTEHFCWGNMERFIRKLTNRVPQFVLLASFVIMFLENSWTYDDGTNRDINLWFRERKMVPYRRSA